MEFRKQHSTPKRYLKRFCINENIWFYDGKRHISIHFGSQNQRKYYFSKKDPMTVEKILKVGEDILLGSFNKLELFIKDEVQVIMLLIGVIGFNLRSPIYVNKTELERYDTIQYALSNYIIQQILGFEEKGQSLDEICYDLSCLWKMYILKISKDSREKFITSDCPTVIATDANGGFPCFVFFPVSPTESLFFCDKRKYILKDQNIILSHNEIKKLNDAMCVNSDKKIYSQEKLSDLQLQKYKQVLTDEQREKGEIFLGSDGKFQIKTRNLVFQEETINQLSFLQRQQDIFEIISYHEAQEIYKSGALEISEKTKIITIYKSLSKNQLYCALRAKYIDDKKKKRESDIND